MIGLVIVAVSVSLGVLEAADDATRYYVSACGNLVTNLGTMLFCTLPPYIFDLDLALTRWKGGRRLLWVPSFCTAWPLACHGRTLRW